MSDHPLSFDLWSQSSSLFWTMAILPLTLLTLFLFLCLIHALAVQVVQGQRRVVLVLLLLVVLAGLLEHVGLLHQLLVGHSQTSLTTVRSARLLSGWSITLLSLSTWLMMEQKSKQFEEKLSDGLVYVIIALMTIFVLLLVVQVVIIDDNFNRVRMEELWILDLILPFYLPLLISLVPLIRMGHKLFNYSVSRPEHKSSISIALTTSLGFFVVRQLHVALLTIFGVELLALDEQKWHSLVKLHFWYVLRPFLEWLGLFSVPLAVFSPFLTDEMFKKCFPANLIFRENQKDDIVDLGAQTGTQMTTTTTINMAKVDENGNETNFEIDPEADEYNQSIMQEIVF